MFRNILLTWARLLFPDEANEVYEKEHCPEETQESLFKRARITELPESSAALLSNDSLNPQSI